MARECDICCETFDRSKHAKVECPSCDANICRTCTRKYLLESNDEPHCMACKSRWERDTFIAATLKSFVDNQWKSHHGDGLIEQEMSRLPSTMPAVENYKTCLKLEEMEKQLLDEYTKIRHQMDDLCSRRYKITEEINARRNGNYGKTTKKAFIKKCPGEGCNGFLSTQYKCELCGIKVCSKCFAIKSRGDEETKHGEHICNEDDLKSAELIKKETRNCPSCGTGIYKLEGCDQMWCTQCHTPFSWKTGKKVHGVIHNPHFYAWQNAGGGQANINAPGAVMCGGLPPIYNYRTGISRAMKLPFIAAPVLSSETTWNDSEENMLLNRAVVLHRATTHFAHVELDRVRTRCNGVTDNEDLRIRFMMNEIDKKEMKSVLLKRDTQRQKAMAILQIYELVNTIFTESVRDIYEGVVLGAIRGQGGSITWEGETPKEIIKRNLNRCDQMRTYANDNLKKVSVMYSQTVRIIDRDFYTTGKKFKRADLAN